MSTNAEQLSKQAWEYIRNGQADLALQLLHGPMLNPESENPNLMALYGYCLCTVQHKRKEGIALCKRAIQLDSHNPRSYYLLGQAYLEAGTKKLAFSTLQKGLDIDPHYQPIQVVLNEMGIRKKPMIPFLSRDNPLNIALGKWRHQRRQSGK